MENVDDIEHNYCRKSSCLGVRTYIGWWRRRRSRSSLGTKKPTVGEKPIVQAKPSTPFGCKLVGTVKGTKIGLPTVLVHQNLREQRLGKTFHRHRPSPLP